MISAVWHLSQVKALLSSLSRIVGHYSLCFSHGPWIFFSHLNHPGSSDDHPGLSIEDMPPNPHGKGPTSRLGRQLVPSILAEQSHAEVKKSKGMKKQDEYKSSIQSIQCLQCLYLCLQYIMIYDVSTILHIYIYIYVYMYSYIHTQRISAEV